MISAQGRSFLVDCGATSLVAMRRFGVEPNAVSMILVSHLHGDHFGGIPFFILDAQLVSKRAAPLLIAGPPGLEARVKQAMEVLFPGSSGIAQKFTLQFRELEPGVPADLDGVTVTPHQVRHPCGDPPLALRMDCDGKTITYSGDTEWCEGLLSAASGAHLFIAEAYTYEKPIRFHLNFKTLEENREALAAGRIVLTHMSADMLERVQALGWEYAEDGKVFHV
jgi:ribonuclease BN (tRNA processing enzyme)